jgi:16S rRNA (cytidine1402-2'-O)-methyltransferase
VLAALSAAGLPTDAFMFAGFLPVKDGQRRSRLEELHGAPATLVFFESPRRLE